MTDEQIKFSTEWSAGDPNKVDQPTTSKTFYDPKSFSQLPPPSLSSSQNDLPPSLILFGNTAENPESFSSDVEDNNLTSFEHYATQDPSFTNFSKNQFENSTSMIPGLNLKETSHDDVIDVEDIKNLPPPPLPNFGLKKMRTVNINDILDEPGRSTRPERLVVSSFLKKFNDFCDFKFAKFTPLDFFKLVIIFYVQR